MAKVDLHVHSRHSDRPSEWFLKRLGAAESYTDPEDLYLAAKSRGMDFVTITDHNCIDGAVALKRMHPEDVIVGVESTTYFPEDGCKVHLLLWGIDEGEFERIQDLRGDIYRLREYVIERRIAHSVAHATFAVNERLSIEHLERLLLLFDNFEVVNGSRTQRQNDLWRRVVEGLSPEEIERLQRDHGIKANEERPWVKGLTGGSDDHAGLLVGRAWTEAPARSAGEYLERLRNRCCQAAGRHNDYRTLAFSIYKIASDFSQSTQTSSTRNLLNEVSRTLFTDSDQHSRGFTLRERVATIRLRSTPLGSAVADLMESLRAEQGSTLDRRLDVAYERIAAVSDEFVIMLHESTKRHLKAGDITALVRDVSAALPAVFLSAPFFSTMRILNRGQDLADSMRARFGVGPRPRGKRVLWFSDTLGDLNGVSVTLNAISSEARVRGHELRLAGCPSRGAESPEILSLPWILEESLPFYERQMLRVPSVLKALRLIQEYDPDEIIVSTPGPVGATGLLAAKLLETPCRAIYHTDFGTQVSLIGGDEAPVEIVDAFVNWFYGQFDEVLATSDRWVRRLEDRGVAPERLGVFKRGVDTGLFAPRPATRAAVRRQYGFGSAFVCIYAGRLSAEKSLDVIIDAQDRLVAQGLNTMLVLAGDGPEWERLRERTRHLPGVVFPGRLDREQLATLYSACDVLVFPSMSDTFGMAVLEGQASGLPALVSAADGPSEVIVPGKTGLVVSRQDAIGWAGEIMRMIEMAEVNRTEFAEMGASARRRALEFSWDAVFAQVMRGSSANHVSPSRPPIMTSRAAPRREAQLLS